jgi:tetratricopeptide (TPR) repeat protein
MKRLFVAFSAMAFAVAITSVSAQERDDQKKGRGGREAFKKLIEGREAFKKLIEDLEKEGFTKDQIRGIVQKSQRGEQLSEKELAVAKKVQDARTAAGFDRNRGGDRGGQQGGRPDRGEMMRRMMQARAQQNMFAKVSMNPLDATYHDLAETYYKAQKYVEAVDSLRVTIEKSPDKEAKGAARFNAAQIYRQGLNYYSHAAEEYLQVEGKLRARALRELLDMFENQAKDLQLAIDTLSELAKQTQDKGDKVDILRALASAYSRAEKPDEAVSTLKSITQLLTYEEAVEMKDHYSQGDSEEALQGRGRQGFNPMMMMRGRGGPPGDGFGRPGGGQGRPGGGQPGGRPGGDQPGAGGAQRPQLEK